MRLAALVTFVSADGGGRASPPSSGYRPPVRFGEQASGGEPALWDFEFHFAGDDRGVQFDEETPTIMRAVTATSDDVTVDVGETFEVREGARVVGRGRVTEVLPG